jgi:dinuclear metal center YbgI/SA1388 family protein
MQRDALAAYCEAFLETARFSDYCPNGLQVEGRAQVSSIVSGVTASAALLDAAILAGADAIFVHHGYFWKSDTLPITGLKKARIARLLAHDINLFAFHLPLDAHPQVGNNAQLGRVLGWTVDGTFGQGQLGVYADLQAPTTAGEVAALVQQRLGRTPTLLGDAQQLVKRVGWCTGGAQNYFEAAIDAGCTLFLSGEVSEPTHHLAVESGAAYLACGHHATERYGIAALGEHLAAQFGLSHRFIDIPNPV